ncbi:TraV family lipoprotein [Neiella sp. HB171785]|uniref:TraV family lipoprotein n=1 Tax=Neiella litorisoli TaxID=2771431 RepID=A0A8J6QIP7_9GAMM|nr:TraV family lipoprotein [Neiella litorisoli]MBD1389412.1 TraV family lipoprotein [Neiella litorisoli]
MNNLIKVTLLTGLISAALSGCSSLSIGEETFNCDEQPKGYVGEDHVCDGPREIYKLTNSYKNVDEYREANGMNQEPEQEDDSWFGSNDDDDNEEAPIATPTVPAPLHPDSTMVLSPEQHNIYQPLNSNTRHDASDYQAAHAIQPEAIALTQYSYAPSDLAPEPLAILNPPQILRILFAPWRDETGDLNMPGYVYSNVQEEEWLVGDDANNRPGRMTPLVVKGATATEGNARQHRAKGVDGLGVKHPSQPNMTPASKAQANQ